ncbi:MAG: hypothetical protein JNK33_06085 [Candidatus Doudnabacteria bacterium]|nr:hypothetical protein [Candidatus Doudnabacteria bacterium]
MPTANTTFADMTPYLNYVKIDSTILYDAIAGTGGTVGCGNECYRLHNGAVLLGWSANSFGGTASTNAIVLVLDPDASRSTSNSTTPGKSVGLILYFNEAITSYATSKSGAITNNRFNNNPAGLSAVGTLQDPDWLSWN